MAYTLHELAEAVEGQVKGDPEQNINDVATIQHAGPDSITFLANRSYRKYLQSTGAGAVILAEKDLDSCPVAAIVVSNPYLAYAKIAGLLRPIETPHADKHPSASIDPSARISLSASIAANVVIEAGVTIGEDTVVGPGCVIQQNTQIGSRSKLIANVTLCHDVKVGNDVILHPGVVIGADGFGIANDQGQWVKVPQLGSVVIANKVEVGANTTIDRGALEDTIIEAGVKLDNQIQVAHNVRIGENTAIAGCTGIAGSTVIGKQCAIGGAVNIVGHLMITDHVQITAGSTVTQDITEAGLYSSGTPLQKNSQWHRNFVRFRQLDSIAKKIRQLEKLIQDKPAG